MANTADLKSATFGFTSSSLVSGTFFNHYYYMNTVNHICANCTHHKNPLTSILANYCITGASPEYAQQIRFCVKKQVSGYATPIEKPKQSLASELAELAKKKTESENNIGRQKFDENVETLITNLKKDAANGFHWSWWNEHDWPDNSDGFIDRALEWAKENGLNAVLVDGHCGEDDLPYNVLKFNW